MSNLTVQDIFSCRLGVLMRGTRTTQQDLAEAIGTTRQAISQYIKGAVLPNIEKLYKLAEYFEVSADWLIGLPDCKQKKSGKEDARIINELAELCKPIIDWIRVNGYDFHSVQIDSNGVRLLLTDTFVPTDYICETVCEK